MALDPHPDREPGMDARVQVSETELWCLGLDHNWWPVGEDEKMGATWQQLARWFPDATVVLP